MQLSHQWKRLFGEQHNLRKGLPCLTNLLIERYDWVGAKDKSIHVDVSFTDLSKTFDKAPHLGLKSNLERFKPFQLESIVKP